VEDGGKILCGFGGQKEGFKLEDPVKKFSQSDNLVCNRLNKILDMVLINFIC
jgi:hypothetical protein